MIAMVAAATENGVIGRDNALPWKLPSDLQHFRDITEGKTVVMGSKTFQSIVQHRGKPLPNRKNVVLTRDTMFTYPGVTVLHDPQDVTTLADDIYVIGGAQIYKLLLDVADTIYLTEIHAVVDGDAFFPKLDSSVWHEIEREPHQADELNQYAFDFVTYKKS